MLGILLPRIYMHAVITLAVLDGCGGNALTEICPGGAGGLAGGSNSAICPSSTGGSSVYCPQLRTKFASCAGDHLASDTRTINMLLVVDKSSSMNDPISTTDGRSRWDVMKSVLTAGFVQIDGTNEDIKADMNLGLELFPYDSSRQLSLESRDPRIACQVAEGDAAIAVKIDSFVSNIHGVFDTLNAQSPGGWSPTAHALQQAYNYYVTGPGRCLQGSKWALLVTNGSGNCNSDLNCGAQSCTQNLNGSCLGDVNCCDGAGFLCQDDDAVVAAISQLAEARVKTYVVGMPDNEASKVSLNAYARAGKIPNQNGPDGELYYPLSDSTDGRSIEDMFRGIIAYVDYTCEFVLGQTPTNPSSIRVFANCLEVPPAIADGSSNGWALYTDDDPPHVRLQGDACYVMTRGGAKALDIIYDCPN